MGEIFDSVLMPLGAFALASYFFRMWLQDYRANAAGTPNRGALPGATSVGRAAILIAVVGSLILLGLEWAGEEYYSFASEQSEMTVLFGLVTIFAAPFIEEMIFRGFLYYGQGTRWQLAVSCVLVSLLFAVVHPYLWKYAEHEEVQNAIDGIVTTDDDEWGIAAADDENAAVVESEQPPTAKRGFVIFRFGAKSFALMLTNPKALFSTLFVFLGSLWWYYVRFFRLNPKQSLIPCVAGHAAKNLGVFAIKAGAGFVTGIF